MKINVGSADRILRIVAGLVLIALAATGTVGWWGWLGVIPLATGLFRVCPAYGLLGVNTGVDGGLTQVLISLVVAVIGAVILIFIGRLFTRNRAL